MFHVELKFTSFYNLGTMVVNREQNTLTINQKPNDEVIMHMARFYKGDPGDSTSSNTTEDLDLNQLPPLPN